MAGSVTHALTAARSAGVTFSGFSGILTNTARSVGGMPDNLLWSIDFRIAPTSVSAAVIF